MSCLRSVWPEVSFSTRIAWSLSGGVLCIRSTSESYGPNVRASDPSAAKAVEKPKFCTSDGPSPATSIPQPTDSKKARRLVVAIDCTPTRGLMKPERQLHVIIADGRGSQSICDELGDAFRPADDVGEADDVVDGQYENLAVANSAFGAGASDLGDRGDRFVEKILVDGDLECDFAEQRGASRPLLGGQATLLSVAKRVANRHPLDADFVQGLLHGLELR